MSQQIESSYHIPTEFSNRSLARSVPGRISDSRYICDSELALLKELRKNMSIDDLFEKFFEPKLTITACHENQSGCLIILNYILPYVQLGDPGTIHLRHMLLTGLYKKKYST
jgi:hypothetical protein